MPPSKVLERILALSRANSWGVCAFAGACALLAAVQAQWTSAAWGALISLAGAVEVHGQVRLRGGEARGLGGMIGSQFLVLASLWAYAWFRWRHFDPDALWNELPAFVQVQINGKLTAGGLDPIYDRPLFLQFVNVLVCLVLVLVTSVYQGGLALYYALKSGTIRAALKTPSTEPPPLG